MSRIDQADRLMAWSWTPARRDDPELMDATDSRWPRSRTLIGSFDVSTGGSATSGRSRREFSGSFARIWRTGPPSRPSTSVPARAISPSLSARSCRLGRAWSWRWTATLRRSPRPADNCRRRTWGRPPTPVRRSVDRPRHRGQIRPSLPRSVAAAPGRGDGPRVAASRRSFSTFGDMACVLGFRAWSLALTRNRLVRHDGPLSVLRGFTREELLAPVRSADRVGPGRFVLISDFNWRSSVVARDDHSGIAGELPPSIHGTQSRKTATTTAIAPIDGHDQAGHSAGASGRRAGPGRSAR